MADKTYVCGFRHCRHDSPEVSGDEAVKIKNRYYHEDCAKDYNNIEKIIELYTEKISNTVVIPQLRNVINNIIFKKNVPSEFLLFAVKYAISVKKIIKSPYTLHYLIDNYDIKKAWQKRQSQPINKIKFEVTSTKETVFNIKPTKEKGIDSLFD